MKFKHFIFVFCLSLLQFHVSLAQKLIFKNYTVENGLVANPIRRIYQDAKGFMWIATTEGLSKFDGNRFINYTIANNLSHNMVNDIYGSVTGDLYVAENNGNVDILRNDIIIRKASYKGAVINRFCILKDHRVLGGTDGNGLLEIRTGTINKPLQSFAQATYNDLEELNDSLLIGCSEVSLIILNKRLELYSEIKLPKGLLMFRIYKDLNNRTWIGTNKGLRLLSASKNKESVAKFYLSADPFGIPLLKSSNVNDIFQDEQGVLWIGSSEGLIKIDPNNRWQIFTEKDGLPSANVTCIYQDKEKNIWIGTALGIAKLVTKNSIQIFGSNDGLAAQSIDVMHPLSKDTFIIKTLKQIQLFNNRTNKFSGVINKPSLLYSGVVQNSQPILFFGNNNRLGKLIENKPEIVNESLPSQPDAEVYCAIEDAHGIIFSGTHKGLVIRLNNRSYYEQKLPYRITSLMIDKAGYLWVGTWENGLFRVKYSGLDHALQLTVTDLSSLIVDKTVRSLLEDSKGRIWVGTRYKGISLLKYNDREVYKTKYLDIQHGLTSNWTRAMAEDSGGCIWLGSDLGIDKLIPTDTSFQVFNFSRVNNYFVQVNHIIPIGNKTIWFSTNNGLVKVIDGESEKTAPANVYITSVGLGDSSFDFHHYTMQQKLHLKYYQNEAKFEFAAPGFINEKQTLYSYRLWGSPDTSWSASSNQHSVLYASLQPGNYSFEVRTLGLNVVWSFPVIFSFVIDPPYWQTGWFYAILLLLLMLLFYGIYKYRVRQLLKLQNIRNRIASDLHDDIGSTLTNINILTAISRKKLGDPPEAEKFLQRISEEVTATSEALNDIIWSVNTRNDSMQEMLSRMRRYAADLFDNSETSSHLELDEDIGSIKLSMELRRDIYLIYKEALNNVVKHAGAANVWIKVTFENYQLHLIFKDDGKGFDPKAITSRNGLKNIRSRVEKWKGKMSYTSGQGRGTSLDIYIPV